VKRLCPHQPGATGFRRGGPWAPLNAAHGPALGSRSPMVGPPVAGRIRRSADASQQDAAASGLGVRHRPDGGVAVEVVGEALGAWRGRRHRPGPGALRRCGRRGSCAAGWCRRGRRRVRNRGRPAPSGARRRPGPGRRRAGCCGLPPRHRPRRRGVAAARWSAALAAPEGSASTALASSSARAASSRAGRLSSIWPTART
jgi:hypothetical protein